MNFEIAPKETEIKTDWYGARIYCFSLNVDGKTGWRLPAIHELIEIYESNNDFKKWYYWSDAGKNEFNAWLHNFSDGHRFHTGKAAGCMYVRAIRDLV